MLSSGIPRINEYQELDKEPDFKRLLKFSRGFRAEVEARDFFSRVYSIKWVKDPFLQWSRRWEYVYVLQRLENWWKHEPHALNIADAGSGFTFFPFYLQRQRPDARICCIDADPTAGRAIHEAARILGNGPSFLLEDLEELNQASESLHAVFSVSVIEHTAKPPHPETGRNVCLHVRRLV
jgi:2-polyprenyl-3-methyl-5-hydroxy-6-metoxy-1,4-benzoquinol methylase